MKLLSTLSLLCTALRPLWSFFHRYSLQMRCACSTRHSKAFQSCRWTRRRWAGTSFSSQWSRAFTRCVWCFSKSRESSTLTASEPKMSRNGTQFGTGADWSSMCQESSLRCSSSMSFSRCLSRGKRSRWMTVIQRMTCSSIDSSTKMLTSCTWSKLAALSLNALMDLTWWMPPKDGKTISKAKCQIMIVAMKKKMLTIESASCSRRWATNGVKKKASLDLISSCLSWVSKTRRNFAARSKNEETLKFGKIAQQCMSSNVRN